MSSTPCNFIVGILYHSYRISSLRVSFVSNIFSSEKTIILEPPLQVEAKSTLFSFCHALKAIVIGLIGFVSNPRSFSLVDTCIIPKPEKNCKKVDFFSQSTFFSKLVHLLVIHEEAPPPVLTFHEAGASCAPRCARHSRSIESDLSPIRHSKIFINLAPGPLLKLFAFFLKINRKRLRKPSGTIVNVFFWSRRLKCI